MNEPRKYSLHNLSLSEVLDLLQLVRAKAESEAAGIALFKGDECQNVCDIFRRDYARAVGLETKVYRLFVGLDL